MSDESDIKYLVLPDSANPYLLARVRWPDLAQAISVGRPFWQDDYGLFDLPYDPSSRTVTEYEAAQIASGWGCSLRFDEAEPVALIRRMPATWSDMTPADMRAWALEPADVRGAPVAGPARRHALSGTRSREKAVVDFVERRRYARFGVEGRALINCGSTISADLVNISQGGVHCVVATRPELEPGDRLGPPFLLEDSLSKTQVTLDVGGSVTWHRVVGPRSRFGAVFGALDGEQIERVQRFLVTVGAGLNG